jgi:hypothetical protein
MVTVLKPRFQTSSAIGKKGQVSIWIIVSVVVVAIIGLFFAFTKGPSGGLISSEGGAENFIKSCVRDVVKDGVDFILPRGGFVDHRVFTKYNNISVEYLCKNSGYYKPCINQHPTYLRESIGQLEDYVEPGIESCFVELKDNLEERNFDVDISGSGFELDFAPERMFVDLQHRIEISGKENLVIDGLNIEVASPLYDLMNLAIEISNQESQYCYFNSMGYMLFYPKFEIEKKKLNDGSIVYIVKDVASGNELKFAVRGCALPAGLG